MEISRSQRNTFILLLTVFACLALFAWRAPVLFSSFWTDSEIWGVTSSRFFFSRLWDFQFAAKPLFHLILGTLAALSEPLDPSGISRMMDTARAAAIMNSMLLLFSVALAGRRWGGSWLTGAIACLALLASESFTSQMWTVRSDIWAIPWVILGALALTERRFSSAAVLFLLAFWITPKSALIALVVIATLVPAAPAPSVFLRRRNIWVLAILSILIWQSGDLFRSSLNTFNEFFASEMGLDFFSAPRWMHVIHALNSDPWFWLGSILSAFFLFYGRTSAFERRMAVLILALFALLLVYPAKLPFFIASLQPLMALGMAHCLLRRLPLEIAPWGAALFAVIVSSVVLLRPGPPPTDNLAQRVLAEELNLYHLQRPYATVFDGLGLALRQPLSSFYIGPGQKSRNEEFPRYLQDEDYLLVVETEKVFLLRSITGEFLNENYVPSPSGLWRRSLKISDSQTAVELADRLRETFFAVLTEDSILYFENDDGTPASVEVLGPGSFRDEASEIRWSELVTNSDVRLRPRDGSPLRVTPLPPLTSATGLSFLHLFRYQALTKDF